MALFSSVYSFGQSNMDVQHISRENCFSESSHTWLTSQQKLSVLQFDFPVSMNSKSTETTTIVKERSYRRPPHPLWTLPQESSNQSLTSGRVIDAEGSHSRAFSRIYSAKRLKGPITPPLPSPLSPCKQVITSGLSRPLLEYSEAKTASPERVDPAEAPGNQLDSDRSNSLRSPFEYTQDIVTSQVDPSTKFNVQRFDSKRPAHSENSPGHMYYAPMNASDNTNRILDAHRRVPHRQLSYGGPPSKPGSRSLHKTTGSWELRRDAQRHTEDYDLNTWSGSTLNYSASRPYHSEPTRSKPRVWPDLTEQKTKIQQAVSVLMLQERQKQLP